MSPGPDGQFETTDDVHLGIYDEVLAFLQHLTAKSEIAVSVADASFVPNVGRSLGFNGLRVEMSTVDSKRLRNELPYRETVIEVQRVVSNVTSETRTASSSRMREREDYKSLPYMNDELFPFGLDPNILDALFEDPTVWYQF